MRNTCLSDCYARSTHPIVVHTHARSGDGWADWGDSHGGNGVRLTVEYPWHRAPRNTLRPQWGQRSGSARLSSGPADRCVPFCPFFEATRGKRAANHQVCSGLPLPTAVVPLPPVSALAGLRRPGQRRAGLWRHGSPGQRSLWRMGRLADWIQIYIDQNQACMDEAGLQRRTE